jgi:putative radical SAM enzyme (TIGR03279 family)
MVQITGIEKKSYAKKAGILSNDILVSINGNEITDVLDYRFYITEKKLEIVVQRDGEEKTFIIKKKDEYDDIGLEFETFLMDSKHSCRNKCIFCFIDQLPKGMRETLYFKDDDSRLSFLQGNYITLTNMTEEDIDRIIKMRMSPINISVHTTDPELRVKMLKNPRSGEVLSYIKKLADAGIEINAQIVLCRGVNDGENLTRTMHDLACMYPQVSSVSIVPAGLTKHRDGLYPLTPFSKAESAAVVAQVEAFAAACKASLGSSIFYCGDELYLEAGLPLHDGEYYEGYRQIENGVGMISSMKDELASALENEEGDGRKRAISIATGHAAYGFICECAEKIKEKFPNIKINVYEIRNDFFGESVTVAGLVTGRDLVAQLSGKELYGELMLPVNMLRHGGDLFLCGMSKEEAEDKLSVSITLCENDGYEFLDKIIGNEW